MTNTYNTEGRLATQKDGSNNTTSFGYAPGQTTITDPRNHATTQLFDLRWRATQQSDQVGQNTYTLQYVYDSSGNMTASIDRNGNRTTPTTPAATSSPRPIRRSTRRHRARSPPTSTTPRTTSRRSPTPEVSPLRTRTTRRRTCICGQRRGSTGSLFRASTPKTHS